MNRIFYVLTITLSLALISLAGCGEALDDTGDDVASVEQAASPNYTDEDGCRYLCRPCPPNQICTAVCEPIGACEHQPEREECGDTICPVGTECCNASCGICVEPGGYCTQQICEDDSEER